MLRMEKLSPLIKKIVSNNLTQREILYLVHICKSLTKSYLKTQRFYNKLYMQTNHPDEISDIAIDVIAPLFSRDNDGCFYELKRYFYPLLQDIESNDNLALIHLRRIVVSKAKQELINVFKQHDPAGWRIYRNLQLVPKHNNQIGIFRDFGRIYYYYKTAPVISSPPMELRPELEEISFEDLKQRVIEFQKLTNKTPEVVELVLKSLQENDEYCLFVSREKLFIALKAVWGLQMVQLKENQFETNRYVYPYRPLPDNHNGMMKKISLHIQNVIDKTYVRKQKMTSKNAVQYMNVLNAYFNDLLSSGSPQKIPQYMNHRSENDMFQDNWNLHKNRLEYMIKLGKKHLRGLLEK